MTAFERISEPDPRLPRFALFALGFRPFFLAGGLSAVILMVSWLIIQGRGLPLPAYYGPIGWHGHEMLFGYTMAVVAGFLLTAVSNWTGQPTAKGRWLALLVGLWLAGRLAPLFASQYPLVAALADLAFLPAVGIAVAVPLLRAGQRQHYVIAVIIALLLVANALTHSGLGLGGEWSTRGLTLGVNTVALLIGLMGGRVIPFFIERAVIGAKRRSWRAVEIGSMAGLALVMVLEFFAPASTALALAATAAALFNGLRLAGWHHRDLWRNPLLWVLFMGYGWLVVGLLLKGVAALGLVAPTTVLHAITVGAIGVLTLGMMPRVSLGHTGREMKAPATIPTAFLLINLAVLVRVFGPIIAPEYHTAWIHSSGTLWEAAFLLFSLRFLSILIRPRVDGRPG